MYKKIFAIGIIVIVLIIGLYYFNIRGAQDIAEENSYQDQTQSLDEDRQLEVGKEAPDFTLLNLNEEEVSLSDFKGQYVLANFWGIWCQWCDLEMPDLQRVHDENDDLVVLAVNVMEETDDVIDYVEENNYSFPVVLDSDGAVARTYLISGFPTTYFIDKDGNLLGGLASYMNYEQMDKIIDSIRE